MKARRRIKKLEGPLRLLFKKNRQLSYFLHRRIKRSIYSTFGFVANPLNPDWMNGINCLGRMPLPTYFNKLGQNNYHNLCTSIRPPINCGDLLGLGLKFCVQNRRIDRKALETGVERFQWDVWLKFYFLGGDLPTTTNHLDKQKRKLYIKSKWPPPLAFKSVEDRMKAFSKELFNRHDFIKKVSTPATNLSKIQLKIMRELRADKS